jgi:predicted RNase H-like HicB family nuclease
LRNSSREKQTDRRPFDRKAPTEENIGSYPISPTRIGGKQMDIYQLDYVLHEPEESEGWMYLAEAPALQGCTAWGNTPAETLHELIDVARMLIELRKENREPLLKELIQPRSDKGSLTITA